MTLCLIMGNKKETGAVQETWCQRHANSGKCPPLPSRSKEAKEHYVDCRWVLWVSLALFPPASLPPSPSLLGRGLFTKIKCVWNANLLGKHTRLVRVAVISCPGSSSHGSGHPAPKLALISSYFSTGILQEIGLLIHFLFVRYRL